MVKRWDPAKNVGNTPLFLPCWPVDWEACPRVLYSCQAFWKTGTQGKLNLPARWALTNNNVVLTIFILIPTAPLFPTRPPMSPAVTADLEVPSSRSLSSFVLWNERETHPVRDVSHHDVRISRGISPSCALSRASRTGPLSL